VLVVVYSRDFFLVRLVGTAGPKEKERARTISLSVERRASGCEIWTIESLSQSH
jgi:hypothetical protein